MHSLVGQNYLNSYGPLARRCHLPTVVPIAHRFLDAQVDADFSEFRVPDCPSCGGVLKPAVVFFGENVPRSRVDAALAALAAADALLVVGSSLMVFSGFRFCLAARELGKPVAAVNLGRTRADELLSLKVASDCGRALPDVVEALGF